MTIVLAGKNSSVNEIESVLAATGLDCIRAETPEALKSLSDLLPVLLLRESSLDPFLLNDDYMQRTISGLNAREAAVLLLDLDKDAPDFVLRLVLKRALAVAAAKRPVYVLARSIRSGLPETEKLYADARRSGAAFIKYENITVNLRDGKYSIEIKDGKINTTVDTPLLVDCSLKEDKEWMGFAKALRLHAYGNGLINEDRWFLYPGRTSRRGVFFIDTGVILSGKLNDTLISIADEVKRFSETTAGLYAHVNSQKCAFCYTCYRVCPHGSLEPDTAAAAMRVIEHLCDGCGICAAICPANAIEMHSETTEAELGPSENTEFADNSAQKPPQKRMIAFCCENSAAIAAKTVFRGMDIQLSVIPCGGYLNAERIADALKKYERVLVAVCADEACRHFDGSARACLQTEKVNGLLEKLGLDPRRLELIRISHAMPEILKNAAGSLLNDGG